jgi:hypothetical protein
MQTLIGLATFLILVGLSLLGLQAGGQVPQAVILLLSAGVGLAVWRAQETAKQAQDLEAKLGSDKGVLYKLYVDIIRDIFDKGAKADTTAVVKKLMAWSFGSMLIASDEVVLAHDRFMNASRMGEQLVLPAVADVILAMRRDAGDAGSGLQTIDILQTFIKAEDIDTMKALCAKWEAEKAKAWPMTRPRKAPSKP